MELVVVKLNTGAELDATECVEVAGAELVGSMDLGSGHDGKGGGLGRAGAGMRREQNPSCDRERGCTTQSVASE
jgi:hypothetical protein